MKKLILVMAVALVASLGGCAVPAGPPPRPVSVAAPTAKPEPPPKPQPPVVKSLKPDTGPADGRTEVQISGSYFGRTVAVAFDGISASNVRAISDALVLARTPAHLPGEVDVVVTNPDGTCGTLQAGFNYTASPRVSPKPSALPAPTPTITPRQTPSPSPVPQVKIVSLEVVVMPARGGKVTLSPPGGVYAADTKVTITPFPADGYRFVSWSGDLLGPIRPIVIIVDSNKRVTAHFVPEGW